MSKEMKRECPNCKTEILVTFEDKRLGHGEIKECPGCGSPVLFCPDGYIVESITSFVRPR
ncbi:MAG TPA: hypothetical protein ENN18_05170 [Proteobacteria bacterium]|nr:hypothetical protein [Pseudomonadota bacterium]